MVNISASLTITVENIGITTSGTIDVNVLLLHDDYDTSNSLIQPSKWRLFREEAATRSTYKLFRIRRKSHPAVKQPPRFPTTTRATMHVNNRLPLAILTSIAIRQPHGRLEWLDAFNGYINFPRRSCHAGNGQSSNYNNNATLP